MIIFGKRTTLIFGVIMSLNGKSILITGGTGSFGRSMINSILRDFKPKRLVVYSRDELKQFDMMKRIKKDSSIRFFIGDVRDYSRLVRALSKIDIVIHAAALKQVVSSEYNPIECIKTNINGAENVINAAIDTDVKKVIALSTDKAVNPINLYGASKLCSDKLFIAANNLSGRNGPVFSVVRYGNVLGSRGSVLDIFKESSKKGYFNVTHKNMTRFFITVDNAVKFVCKSLDLMKGGEIFIPKIPSVKIVDLARAICAKSKINFIGIRPGEKLHELMIPSDESSSTLEFKDFYILQSSILKSKSIIYNKKIGEPVDLEFSYSSENNPEWLSIGKIREIIKTI